MSRRRRLPPRPVPLYLERPYCPDCGSPDTELTPDDDGDGYRWSECQDCHLVFRHD
jgi:hypothetical protein